MLLGLPNISASHAPVFPGGADVEGVRLLAWLAYSVVVLRLYSEFVPAEKYRMQCNRLINCVNPESRNLF